MRFACEFLQFALLVGWKQGHSIVSRVAFAKESASSAGEFLQLIRGAIPYNSGTKVAGWRRAAMTSTAGAAQKSGLSACGSAVFLAL